MPSDAPEVETIYRSTSGYYVLCKCGNVVHQTCLIPVICGSCHKAFPRHMKTVRGKRLVPDIHIPFILKEEVVNMRSKRRHKSIKRRRMSNPKTRYYCRGCCHASIGDACILAFVADIHTVVRCDV